MPRLLPMKPKQLENKLKEIEFSGPFSGAKHRFMKKGNIRIPIPNPHGGKDVSVGIIEQIIEERLG